MSPPDAKRPPRRAAASNAWEGVGRRDHDTAGVKPTCPIACSRPDTCPWRCPVDVSDAVAEVVDAALEGGRIVLDRCRVVVPDVVEAECVANGRPAFPTTSRIRRHDGRSVAVFARPS